MLSLLFLVLSPKVPDLEAFYYAAINRAELAEFTLKTPNSAI
jgi:hypothetical protein